MQRMFEDYSDLAEFRLVYIREAHAADSDRAVGYAKDLGLLEHQNHGQRCTAAEKLLKDEKLSMPCIIDRMDNKVSAAYKAHPDRVFLVRKDGRLGVAGKRGPMGLAPGLDAAKSWLAAYKRTGFEPDVTFAQATQEKPKRRRGLKLFDLGDEESADDRPEQQTRRQSRRDRPRFGRPITEARDASAVVGAWQMRSEFGGQVIEATMTLALEGGALSGVWSSMGQEMELEDVVFEDGKLSFKRVIPGGPEVAFEGTIDGEKIAGQYTTPFGELESSGERIGASRPAAVARAGASLLNGLEKSFVVVGYSTSFAWPQMLQDMLNEHARDRHIYHVLNAVVGGSPVERWIADPGSDIYDRTFGAMVRDYFGDNARLRGHAPEPTIALCQQSLQLTGARLGPVNAVDDVEGIRVGADALEKLATRLHREGIDKVYLAMHIYKEGYEPQVGNERFALKELLQRQHDFVFEGPDVWSMTIAEHPRAFAEDGLHPNTRGMKLMAEAWYRTLAGADARQDIIDGMHDRDYDVEQIMDDYLAGRRVTPAPARETATEAEKDEPAELEMTEQERAQKIQDLTGDIIAASNGGDRDKALSIALEALRHAEILQKQGSGQGRRWLSLTNYNTACMYSLLNRKDQAFDHLSRSVELGSFSNRHLSDLLETDSDFDNIRSDPRFKDALSKARGESSDASGGATEETSPYRGLLGPESDKVRQSGHKTLLWASGDRDSHEGKWYDFTGAPMAVEELQFGIGQDRIKSIDDPVFVEPDDARLLDLPASRYRSGEKAKRNDDIMVIGYEVAGDARAYPAALLDAHELVNDLIGGKPLTVGW